MLITFDDGYSSFYTRAYPLLRAYRYPAVLAVVGSWLMVPQGAMVPYGDDQLPRERFMTWEQVREVANSGLVEIASHSFDHHYGIPANPQGNQQPALLARRFDTATGRYEDEPTYRARVRADLAANSDIIRRQTGRSPRTMVWPYGAYNGALIEIARDLGMPVTLTLDDKVNRPSDLPAVGRILLMQDPTLGEFVQQVQNPAGETPIRAVRISLDDLYDPDPAEQERKLSVLINRIYNYGISAVVLQAFSDPDGDGVARQLYFPNRHLPMRADLFNRAAWQLYTRANVRIYAWLPVLGYDFGDPRLLVQAVPGGSAAPDRAVPIRISPFVPEARRRVREIYEDLGASSEFQGLAFLRDAALTEFEDANPAALAYYRDRLGLPASVEAIRADSGLMQRWSAAKTAVLIDFTRELHQAAYTYTSPIATLRSIDAAAVLQPAMAVRFAQDPSLFLRSYDHVAVSTAPLPGSAAHGRAWLNTLVTAVGRHPDGLRRTVFELPTVDSRRGNRPVDDATLRQEMRMMLSLGASHYGYFPDDFLNNRPDASRLHGALSVMTYPFVR